jgi:integrase
VPCFTLDRLPRGPKWEDLPKILATVDRGTTQGRRNFAILLTLMTYGVRAGQLTSLRLDDVNWRDSRIAFPAAKRGLPINAPLTRRSVMHFCSISAMAGLLLGSAKCFSRWSHRFDR